MKVWTTLKVKDENKLINKIAISLTNYIYKNGPINDIVRKYKINNEDKKMLDRYTQNRIAGLLMLYSSKNTSRINDIVNKYLTNTDIDITPELEGYIEK